MKAKCKTTNVLKTEYDPQAVSQPARGVRNGQRLKKAARTASEPAFPDALIYNFLGSFATGTSNRQAILLAGNVNLNRTPYVSHIIIGRCHDRHLTSHWSWGPSLPTWGGLSGKSCYDTRRYSDKGSIAKENQGAPIATLCNTEPPKQDLL